MAPFLRIMLSAALVPGMALSTGALAPGPDARIAPCNAVAAALRPLHRPMDPPREGDWLRHHPEPGQTFEEYRASGPALPRGRRRTLYLQPLGPFTPEERRILDLTAEFSGIYFGLPVKVLPNLGLSAVPAQARRIHPAGDHPQLLSTHLLHRILKPRLPKDAAALLGHTASDLWPGPGWNFVYGQASLQERVGIWSTYAFGDPARSPAAFRRSLLRTLKTATHETAHMFSLLHCTAYECNLNGSNNMDESDRHPLALCPECLAKVVWATGADPARRFEALAAFCAREGLLPEDRFYRRSLQALQGAGLAGKGGPQPPPTPRPKP